MQPWRGHLRGNGRSATATHGSRTPSLLYQHGGPAAGHAPADAAQVRAARAGPADAHRRQHARLLARRARSPAADQAAGRRGRRQPGRRAAAALASPRRCSGCARSCRTRARTPTRVAQEIDASRRWGSADRSDRARWIRDCDADCRASRPSATRVQTLWNSRTTTQTLGVTKSGDREGDQAGVPQARPQASSRRESRATSRPRRRFKEINEAYEVLGDPEKRKKYDELGANWRMYEQARQQGQELARRLAVRRRGRRRWPGTSTWAAARRLPHHDRRGNAGALRQRRIRSRISSTRSSAAAAARARRARAPGRRAQSQPEGPRHRARGRADARGGVSRRHAADLDQAGRARAQRRRADSGRRQGRLARARGRRGRTRRERRRRRRPVPARATRPHPVFERKGDDLHTKVALPVTTAVLGGEAQVPTITGSVRLKIPETTQSGQVFRLKGHGMPVVGKPDDARRSVRHGRRAAPPLARRAATATRRQRSCGER